MRPDPNRFPARLRALRTGAGLTQADLAGRAGLQANHLARLERGERSPTWETVLALAAALGVDCTAFAVPPAARPEPKRGRPSKAAAQNAPSPEQSRGRPKKGSRGGNP